MLSLKQYLKYVAKKTGEKNYNELYQKQYKELRKKFRKYAKECLDSQRTTYVEKTLEQTWNVLVAVHKIKTHDILQSLDNALNHINIALKSQSMPEQGSIVLGNYENYLKEIDTKLTPRMSAYIQRSLDNRTLDTSSCIASSIIFYALAYSSFIDIVLIKADLEEIKKAIDGALLKLEEKAKKSNWTPKFHTARWQPPKAWGRVSIANNEEEDALLMDAYNSPLSLTNKKRELLKALIISLAKESLRENKNRWSITAIEENPSYKKWFSVDKELNKRELSQVTREAIRGSFFLEVRKIVFENHTNNAWKKIVLDTINIGFQRFTFDENSLATEIFGQKASEEKISIDVDPGVAHRSHIPDPDHFFDGNTDNKIEYDSQKLAECFNDSDYEVIKSLDSYLKNYLQTVFEKDGCFLVSRNRKEHLGYWSINRIVRLFKNVKNEDPFKKNFTKGYFSYNKDLEVDVPYGAVGHGIIYFMENLATTITSWQEPGGKDLYSEYMDTYQEDNVDATGVSLLGELDQRKKYIINQFLTNSDERDLTTLWVEYASGPPVLTREMKNQPLEKPGYHPIPSALTGSHQTANTINQRAVQLRRKISLEFTKVVLPLIRNQQEIYENLMISIMRCAERQWRLLDIQQECIMGTIAEILGSKSIGDFNHNNFLLRFSQDSESIFYILKSWNCSLDLLNPKVMSPEPNKIFEWVSQSLTDENDKDVARVLCTMIGNENDDSLVRLVSFFYLALLYHYNGKNNWKTSIPKSNDISQTFFSLLKKLTGIGLVFGTEVETTVNWQLPIFYPITEYDRFREKLLHDLKNDLYYSSALEIGLSAPESLLKLPYINLCDVVKISQNALCHQIEWIIEDFSLSIDEKKKKLDDSKFVKNLIAADVSHDLIQSFVNYKF